MVAWPAMQRGASVLASLVLSAALGLACARAGAQSSESAVGLSRPTPPTAAPPTAAPQAVPDTSPPLPSPGDAARSLPLPPPPGPRAVASDGNVDARLASLDGHLSSLAARRGSSAGGAVVSLLMGGSFIGLGVYASRSGESFISSYFYLSGAGAVASAAIQLGLQPNPQRAYLRLQSMNVDASLDTVTRLARTEQLLSGMARKRMAARYLQGAIGLGMTVGSLPILLGGDGFHSADTFDWLIVLSAGIGLVDALTTMFQRSEEERRWQMYQRFAETHGGQAVFSAAPSGLSFAGVRGLRTPGGGGVAARFIF